MCFVNKHKIIFKKKQQQEQKNKKPKAKSSLLFLAEYWNKNLEINKSSVIMSYKVIGDATTGFPAKWRLKNLNRARIINLVVSVLYFASREK